MSDNNCACNEVDYPTIFNPSFSNLKMKVVEYTAATGDTCFDSSAIVTLAVGTCIDGNDVQLTKAKVNDVVAPEYIDVVNALLANADFVTNIYTADIAGVMAQSDLKLLINVSSLTNLQVVTP